MKRGRGTVHFSQRYDGRQHQQQQQQNHAREQKKTSNNKPDS